MTYENTVYDCIVLGAGIAGVTAARDLQQEGLRVLLLEGSERVGGRMYSHTDFIRHPQHAANAERFPLEAGAEYIHVGDRDRYPEFFAELDRHGFVRKKYPKVKRNRLAFPDWKHNPKNLPKSLLRSLTLIPTVTLLGEVDDYERDEDMPAGAYISTKKYRGKGTSLARYTLSSHTPGQLYDPAIDRYACQPSPTDVLDTISIAGFQADRLPHQLLYETSEYKMHRALPGDESEVCPYDELPKRIAKEFLDPSRNPRGVEGELCLGHRVLRVERRGKEIVVRAETAAGEGKELVARSAVCTFSVGMLSPQTGAGDAIFGALLTEPKRAALRSIKMGPITKFSLEFKKSHWGPKSKMTVMSHPRGCARTFFSAFPGEKGPFVLTALLMNQDHRIVQGLDDEAAIRHLLDVLQSLFDRDGKRWRPDEVLVPRSPGSSEPNYYRQDWERDPFARGGNSFISYRAELNTQEVQRLRMTLRDPRDTLPLFWAGEATAPAYNAKYQPLAVHGAYISGVGAAQDVKEYLAGGRADEAFRGACSKKLATVRAAAVVSKKPLRVHLTKQEHSALNEYATARTDGDLGRAVAELCRIGIYLQENQPTPLQAKAVKKVPAQAVRAVLTAEEHKRIRGYADRDLGGDLERTVRALLRLAHRRKK